MDLHRVAPELRRATRSLPVPDVRSAWQRRLARIGGRLLPPVRGRGVRIVTLRADELRLRTYVPEGLAPLRGALVWAHGGGFVIGTPQQDDRLALRIARELGFLVVSPDYRLAPEHPFPAALDDLTAAWGWVQSRAAPLGIDPRQVAVGGESAGGGLAASLTARLLDEGGVQPCGQLLFCPMLDDRTAADRGLDAHRHWVWNNEFNRFAWRAYLGAEPGSESIPPDAAPARRFDLTGLPPTWLSVGDIELFHDEVVAYAGQLRAAGVDVTLQIVPGAPHGFENWAPSSAAASALLDGALDWLRRKAGTQL